MADTAPPLPGRNWAGNQRGSRHARSCARQHRRGRRGRPIGRGRRAAGSRPSAAATRSPPSRSTDGVGWTCPAWPAWSASTGARLVTRAGRHDPARAQRAARPARPGACPTSATSTRRPSPGRSPPAPTAPAPATAACPPSSRRSRWSPAPARCCAARADEHPDVFAGRPGRARRARRPHRGHPALRGRVHPARRRTPDRRWPTCSASSTSCIGRQRPLRVLLVPVHRPGPDQGQQPGAGQRPAAAAAGAAGSTTTSWPTRSSPGACRLGRAVPALVPAISAVSARALTAASYTGRSDLVFCTPRRVRFVEMEYGLPRAALPEALAALRRIIDGLPFKVLFPVEVRFTAADDIWLSHGVRAGQRLHRRSTSTSACRTSRTSGPSRRSPRRWAAGRTGASCTTGTPARCARRTRASTTSWPSATRSTRHRVFANDYT